MSVPRIRDMIAERLGVPVSELRQAPGSEDGTVSRQIVLHDGVHVADWSTAETGTLQEAGPLWLVDMSIVGGDSWQVAVTDKPAW